MTSSALSASTAQPADESPAIDAAEQPPLLSVVSGRPTAEELAALLAVVAARAGSAGADAVPVSASEWAAPRHRMPAAIRRGPGGWRRSALPH